MNKDLKSRMFCVATLLPAYVALCAPPARAAELAPSWTALPDETVLMARLPGGAAFLDALRSRTKLGSVVLSPERLERIAEAIQERSPERWQELREQLGRHDLKPQDWQGLLRGDAGLALTLQPRADRAPLMVALGWLEPGDELAPRLLAALQSLVAEQADRPHAARRQDIELAGHDVLHIELPIVSLALPQVHEVDLDGEETLQEQIDKYKERLKEAKPVESDRIHLFASRLGGRVVWANTLPQAGAETRTKTDAERQALDWDALTGLEQATAVFGQFLAAHEGSPTGGVRRLLQTPGLEASLPGGTTLLEIVADPRPLLKLLGAARGSKAQSMLQAVGADRLGPLALRTALDGGVWRSGVFLSMPAPRGGLLALVDQPPLAPEPPAWAPASAVGYRQISFDLGQAYRRIKDLALAIEQSEGAARQSFDQVEAAVKTFLQIDLNDLLASLPGRHSVVTLPPRMVEAAPGDASASPAVVRRIGLVWQLKDEPIWRQLLKVAGRFAQGGAAGGLQAVEEQGFSGYRLRQASLEFGLFVGQGHLVLGIGPEVTESLLSGLRSPPVGEAALRSSGLVERGRALIAPRPCLAYKLADAGADVKVTRQAIQSILKAPSLLPSDDELDGVLGVSVSQAMATDEGVVIQSALELPSP